MAKTYDRVTGSTGPQTLPAKNISVPAAGGCSATTFVSAAVTANAPPNGDTRSYEPIIRRDFISDPSKGLKRNWQAIKRSGEISMTPYSRSSTVDEYFVVSRNFRNVDWRRVSASCPVPPATCAYLEEPEMVRSTWTENDDFHSLSTVVPHSRVSHDWSGLQDQVNDAISTTQQAAFAEALSTYDILTEIMESKETLRYLTSKLGEAAESLRKFAHADELTHKRARTMTAKQLFGHADKVFRRYGSRWMEYRYAIMPLVYSIKDIQKLMANREAVYKSGRSKVTIDIDIESEKTSDYQTYERIFGKVEIRSLTKVGYNSGALQRVASQVKFNPFTTAWELIPLSFVVDWFLNVGDAINSATTLDFSSQRKSCTVVKRSYVDEIRLLDLRDLTVQKTITSATCGNVTLSDSHIMDVDSLLMKRTTESYNRFLFNRPTPKIVFDPYLSWKRTLDAIVLGHQPTKKLLRSL